MIKNYLSLVVMALLPVAFSAQVGVNTEVPTRTLDVNGDLRVRTIEEATDFAGFLTPSSNEDETNVLKLTSFKTGQTFKANMVSDLVGGEVGEEKASGKITDNRWVAVNFSSNTNSDYAEASNSSIIIKKSGFYHITVSVKAIIDKNDKAYSSISNVDFALLRAYLSARYNNNPIHLGSDFATAIKGGRTAKVGSNSNIIPYVYKDDGNKNYYLNINTSSFFLAGTHIFLQLSTFGLPGIVDKISNFKFTSEGTSVTINRIL